MELERIARILYNMALDMDYNDYIEESELEIEFITKELQAAKEAEMDGLLNILEQIALSNEDMERWKEEVND